MSTMYQTLTNIKNTLLGYKDTTLKTISTWKVGILPPLPAFPCIAILPEKERIIKRGSNGSQTIEREIVIEVYSKATKVSDATFQIQDIMNEIKNIGQIQISGLWNNSCFDFDMYSESYLEPVLLKSNKVIHGGSMRFKFRDHHTIPYLLRKKKSIINETSSKNLVDAVYNIIYSYKNDNTYSLSTINLFDKQDIPALSKFPALTVVEGSTKRYKSLTGIDEVTRTFDISIWTELIDKEASLERNLSLIEILKNILEIEYVFTDSANNVARAYNSQISEITFNRNDIKGLGKVYRSSIQLDVYGFEPLF